MTIVRYTSPAGASVEIDVPGDPWRAIDVVERHLCDAGRDQERDRRWIDMRRAAAQRKDSDGQ